ncbi:MAG: hypothetical protein QXY40_06420 [Candidatus Methanomethylicia archaeon]
MSRAERICERLPKFYKSWMEDSILYKFIKAVSSELDACRDLIVEMMKSHWVDTASNSDLDMMGSIFRIERLTGEDDEHYRIRLRRAIADFTGGGTLTSISSMLRMLIGDDFKIVEYPPIEGYYEVRVMSGDTWILGSNSVEESTSTEIIIEAEDTVENPEIKNLDFNESICFNGRLEKGDKLVVKDGKCLLNGVDVTDRASINGLLRLYRKASTWRYSELIKERIGVFDTTRFDESIFAVSIPKAKISFKWLRYQPATFMVQLSQESLNRSGVSKEYVQEILNSMKAAGVKAIVKVMGG